MPMITPEKIEEVKNRLVKLYDPVAIYIFGSYAWGHPDEDSDLDLLVIVDKIGTHQNDRHYALVAGHKALMDIQDLSKDILLWTKEEFEEDIHNISTLGYTINQKGKKIYAKA